MKNNFKLKYKIVAILSIFIFLFPNLSMAAVVSTADSTGGGNKHYKNVGGNTYSYSLDDDGTGGKDVKDVNWRFKPFFKDDPLDTGLSVSAFKQDEEYGWYVYEANDEEWVVLRRMYTSKNSKTTRSK